MRKNDAQNGLDFHFKVEIEAREVSEGVQSSSQSIKKLGAHPTVGAFVAKGSTSFQIRCIYCEEPRFPASCERVVDSEARKLILRESKRCFNCLRVGHNQKLVVTKKKCRHCDGKLHQSICAKERSAAKNEDNRSKTNKEETKQDGVSKEFYGATTTNRVGKGSVLLLTA